MNEESGWEQKRLNNSRLNAIMLAKTHRKTLLPHIFAGSLTICTKMRDVERRCE